MGIFLLVVLLLLVVGSVPSWGHSRRGLIRRPGQRQVAPALLA